MIELLKALRESQEFKIIMEGMKKERPVIPYYRPQKTMDETANSIEQIKYQSAKQEGFDLLFEKLTGLKP